MTDELRRRVARLRAAFDESFAQPLPTGDAEGQCELLAVTLGASACALRTDELSLFTPCHRLARLRGDAIGFRGLAAVRAGLVAVYDLGELIGVEPSAGFRWLAVPRREPGVAFGVTEFSGHAVVPTRTLELGADRSYARIEGARRLVVDVSRALTSLPAPTRGD